MLTGPLRRGLAPRWLITQHVDSPNTPIFGSSFCAAPAAIAIGAVFVTANLLVTTLAPANTSVLRAPTYQQQKIAPSVTVFHPPNLLTSTLAVAVTVPPITPQVQLGVPAALWQPSDTSKGTPVQQFPVAVVAPTSVAPHHAPQYRHNVVNTAAGSPSVLSGLPTVLNQHQAPARSLWQAADTSRSTPIQQYPVTAVAPFIVAPHYAPQRALWQPPDTSASLPKTLYGDAVAPLFNAPYSAPNSRANWQPVDASQGMPAVLFPVAAVPIPIGQASWVGLQRATWQPGDTSASVPEVLLPVAAAALPPGQASWVALQRANWQPADTSQGSTDVLPMALPIGTASWVSVQRALWQPSDTSQSSYVIPYTVISQPFPPGSALQLPVPQRYWNVVDTTASSPAVALGNVQPLPPIPPVVNVDGGGGKFWYLFYDLTHGKKKKKTEAELLAAELAVAKVIGRSWDQTLQQIESRVRAELRDHDIAIAKHERERFVRALRAERQAERVRQQALADAQRQHAHTAELERVQIEQARQKRNKLLIALLIAMDN